MTENPFHSFWMAGYECSDKLNAFGNRVDFLHLTGHLERLDEDYNNLKLFDIRTVREGIRWSQVEKQPYVYDWDTVAVMMERGKVHGIQQVWDLCHFGFPDDLTPLHPMFARRFAALCKAFVSFYRSIDPTGVLIVTPINEVSFLSWLGGDARGTVPYCTNQGWEVKYGLMKAYIEGARALKEADPSIRMLTTEPLVKIVPPLNATPEQEAEAIAAHEHQYQSVDMLCGKICPELGGAPELIDILGFNFYYNNQWVIGYKDFLPWLNEFPDTRWTPLRDLLREAYERYGRPIALTETSHPQEDRSAWLYFITQECAAIVQEGIPLYGICLYPIIDRPDWDEPEKPWHQSGLWDAKLTPGKTPEMILYEPYAASLLESQHIIKKLNDKIVVNDVLLKAQYLLLEQEREISRKKTIKAEWLMSENIRMMVEI